MSWVIAILLATWGDHAFAAPPAPLLAPDKPVEWWFVFKLSSKMFPECGPGVERACLFGGKPGKYKEFGQQYVFSSNTGAAIKKGKGCVGATEADPVGATFGQIYRDAKYYVVWNDQFYGDPRVTGCSGSKGNCNAPWGHSKGMLAWDDSGEGLVMQVSTPSWPGAASEKFPRKVASGNTLGCIGHNDVLVSQHFFAARLKGDDVVKVLRAMINAKVATDPKKPQIVRIGGPAEVRELAKKLGTKPAKATWTKDTLSNGIQIISKPANLYVPPWQMVSALLGGVSLRTATWWASPYIPTTTATSKVTCWDASLPRPGAVEIALTGSYGGREFGLRGHPSANFNHAKIGHSTSGDDPYVIFGDMNQQGTIRGSNCKSSQNGRGGMFFVVNNAQLHQAVSDLIDGDTAPKSISR